MSTEIPIKHVGSLGPNTLVIDGCVLACMHTILCNVCTMVYDCVVDMPERVVLQSYFVKTD